MFPEIKRDKNNVIPRLFNRFAKKRICHRESTKFISQFSVDNFAKLFKTFRYAECRRDTSIASTPSFGNIQTVTSFPFSFTEKECTRCVAGILVISGVENIFAISRLPWTPSKTLSRSRWRSPVQRARFCISIQNTRRTREIVFHFYERDAKALWMRAIWKKFHVLFPLVRTDCSLNLFYILCNVSLSSCTV